MNGGRKKGKPSKKNVGRKKGKQSKPKKVISQESNETTAEYTKLAVTTRTRTKFCSSYWLNGLHLSRKPNDNRVMLFKEKKTIVSSEDFSGSLDGLNCCLCCGNGCTLNYIACEICGGTFLICFFFFFPFGLGDGCGNEETNTFGKLRQLRLCTRTCLTSIKIYFEHTMLIMQIGFMVMLLGLMWRMSNNLLDLSAMFV